MSHHCLIINHVMQRNKMADEKSPLIQARTAISSPTLSCCKTYKPSLVHSKGANIVLILFGVITISTNILQYSTIQILPTVSIWGIILFNSLIYLLFPVLGYLGEKWTRYKVIMTGVTTIVISYAINLLLVTVLIILDVHHERMKTTIEYLCLVTLILALFGFGLCVANIIQFGTDQLPFAPSQHLAAFTRWSVCVFVFGQAVPPLLVLKDFKILQYAVHCLSFILLVGLVIILGCCCKHHLIIEPPAHIDPVKMIWRVMKYAWIHKYPERRSAFTYGEQPSRLDLAKKRYGGPFTTEKVEDVKSFWHIVLVLLLLFGYTLWDTSGVGKQYVNLMEENTTFKFLQTIVLKSPQVVPDLVVVIGVIIFQLVIFPFFYNYIPGMLKRMWIGILFALFSSITLTVISVVVNNSLQELNNTSICGEHDRTTNITISTSLWPYYVLIIPQFLTGFGFVLSFMTNLEFILAQGPHYMQGTLIGMLFVQTAVSGLNSVITSSTPAGCYWEYYAVLSCLVFMSLFTYSIVAYRYKYRQRNELSDINVRVNIEEIYERNLERELREAREQEEDDTEYHVHST